MKRRNRARSIPAFLRRGMNDDGFLALALPLQKQRPNPLRGLGHAGPRVLVDQVPTLGLQLRQKVGQQVRVTMRDRSLQAVFLTAHSSTRSLLHACPPARRQHQDRQGRVVLVEVDGRVKKMLCRLLIDFPDLKPDLGDGAFLRRFRFSYRRWAECTASQFGCLCSTKVCVKGRAASQPCARSTV